MAIILGTTGDDTLTSSGPGDILRGFDGDDLYIVDDGTDFVLEQLNEGYDVVRSNITFSIAGMANVEELVLDGTGAIDGIGNGEDNLLEGNDSDNSLDGGAGNDFLVGALGNDVYSIDSTGDTILELAGQGTDTVISSIDLDLSTLLLAEIEGLILTGTALVGTGSGIDNFITGNNNANTLDGGAGNDTLDGGGGGEIDTLIGGLGDDIFVVDNGGDVIFENALEGTDLVLSSVTYTLSPTEEIENLTLTGAGTIDGTGNGLDNVVTGNDQVNVLDGADGNDTLDGGLGADTMIGGLGDDTFMVENAADVVSENAAEGTDTIISSVNFNLATNAVNVENLELLAGSGAITGIGDGGVNIITGNGNSNTLDGGGGDDTLTGGIGDDTYFVDSTLDVVVENSAEGTDTIQSSVDFNLSISGQNVENLTLTGAALVGIGDGGDNVITGNANANTLNGAGGNDTLDGSTGADIMIGGSGDDLFLVDDAGDSVTEAGGGGNDTVQTTVTYTLTAAQEVETLIITGAGAIDVTGNATGQFIGGNASANSIDGGGGDDTIDGGTGDDTMRGGTGDDTFYIDSANDVLIENAAEGVDLAISGVSFDLSTNGANVDNLTLTGAALVGIGNSIDNLITGNSLNNTLDGGGGNDTLDGGAGDDVLSGGVGDDLFFVDAAGDIVTESVGQGTDTVSASFNYTLSSGQELENLILTGAAVSGTGNSLDNYIVGNVNNNTLAGNDGNDTLDGGAGGEVDSLIGGLGDDTFVVDNAGDLIFENALQGTDLVQSSVTYTLSLAQEIENLTLTGVGAIDGTGNALTNIITGNAGNNTLNGAAGADTMIGNGGDDTFIVDSLADTVVGGAGIDTIISAVNYTLNIGALANIENLTLSGSAVTATGNALDNIITGNGINNTLVGLGGADTLNGGAGIDSLVGGAGDDTYVVDSQTDVIVELFGEGTADTVLSSVSYTLTAANVENITLSGSANVNATGNAGNNVITGNSGDNTLDGGLGIDSLEGGLGNDTFVVDTLTDIITDAGGNDTISIGVADFDLNTVAGVIENLILTGALNLNGNGDASDNVITGNSGVNILNGNDGNDTLNGGAGGDTMIGGLGDDTFFVDNLLDVILENAGEGTDTIVLLGGLGTYVIPVNVEGLSIIGSSGGNLIGDANPNILTGNDGNNTLDGRGGADTMIGGLGHDVYIVDDVADTIIEVSGFGTDLVRSTVSFVLADNVENLTLIGGDLDATGNDWDNTLIGTTGNNVLDGMIGSDLMKGGAGNDTYFVDSLGDKLVDQSGIDTVNITLGAGANYTMMTGFEILNLLGLEDVNALGTSRSDTMTGNTGANTLNGQNGNDTINGFGGLDVLFGGSGNDRLTALDDGATIDGGAGNDVITSGNGTGQIFGGSGNDTITCGLGSDSIDGGRGNDTMAGGGGDDIYFVDSLRDVVIEGVGFGNDTIFTSVSLTLAATSEVENIIFTGTRAGNLFGSDADNIIEGNVAVNQIHGGAGNDTITTGGGRDTLWGDAGADLFILEAATSFDAKGNPVHVTIKDFTPTDGDVLDISDILGNYDPLTDVLSDFVRVKDYYGSSLVMVNVNGTALPSDFVKIATLAGTNGLTGEAAMVIDGSLVV